MMRKVIFMTGNQRKILAAKAACEEYGITLETRDNDIDEIQHDDPVQIVNAKAKAAFASVGQPVVVQDTSWSVPALGGFPGPYMKDVATWFTVEDWLRLLQGQKDRTILCHEYIAYFDGDRVENFTVTYPGSFIEDSRGEGIGLSHYQLVVLEGSDETVAEAVDRGALPHGSKGVDAWYRFAEWYSKTA